MSNPKADYWPRSYTGIVLSVLFAVAAFLSYYTYLGFSLLVSFAGLALIYQWRTAKIIGPILIVIALSLLWIWIRTPVELLRGLFGPVRGWEKLQWLKTTFEFLFSVPIILTAFRLKGSEAVRAARILAVSMALLAILTLTDGISNGHIYAAISAAIDKPVRPDIAAIRVSINTYTLMMFFWPVILFANYQGWRWISLSLVACLLIAPVTLSANAVSLALVLSGVVFLAAKQWPSRFITFGKSTAIGLGFLILSFPLIIFGLHKIGSFDKTAHHLPASWADRVGIWERTTVKFFEKPITGFGFDFSRDWDSIPLHPHNMALQSALELGAVGLIFLAVIWALILMRIDKGQTLVVSPFYNLDTRPYFFAAAISYFIIAFVSFGLWQEWFIALGTMLIAACLVVKRALEALAEAEARPEIGVGDGNKNN